MSFKTKNFLITGGAGYIGSHVANLLLDKGHKVTIIDNLITGNKKLVPKRAKLYVNDIADKKEVSKILMEQKFDIIMHFAGLISVEESLKKPKKYMTFNYEKAKKFIKICLNYNLNKIIFSSSASVYGNINKIASEKNELKPINPYAKSKKKFENFLISLSKNKKIKFVILRYFNVAGADANKRCGSTNSSSKNLIKLVCEAALNRKKKIILNGDNYKTPDGSPIRDFIHVTDLAEMHYISSKFIFDNKKSQIFNCGYGKGTSVKKVISSMEKIIKRKIPIVIGPRRKNDIVFSVSNVSKFNKFFKWKPKNNSITKILINALAWEKFLKKF